MPGRQRWIASSFGETSELATMNGLKNVASALLTEISPAINASPGAMRSQRPRVVERLAHSEQGLHEDVIDRPNIARMIASRARCSP